MKDAGQQFHMHGVPLPEPDKVEQIPALHPATVRMHESLLRVAKNAIGIWEAWIKERQR